MLFEYRRELAGGALLTTLNLESELLQGNPLGDPYVRSHVVLLPPNAQPGLPLVTILVGYTGFNHKVVNKSSMWEPTVPERIASGMASGEIPPAICVWPSCETRLGGSQYVDSSGTGPYMSYVLDEIIPAVESEYACGGAGRRVIAGKSSGGFGALSLVMNRPGYFTAAASHAGDIGFDMSHFRGFADALTCWEKHGGPAAFLEKLPELHLGFSEHAGVEGLAMASCYSPNPNAELGFDLPVDPETGDICHDVFAKWLKFDPLRLVEQEACAQALRDLNCLYLDAGETDEFALQWGLKRFREKLVGLNVPAHIEFFPGGHFRMDDRFAVSLPMLLGAL
ncbi:MAG: alpha/beta hydrolase-fold protein [Planctomycetota bacterium]|nr:alpha/beta hydrolase-fold protein [Planctomycetota bacterium]MDA1113326.1 alpha/beta hydrolase-fold protein [Planctomycetota bacterium]